MRKTTPRPGPSNRLGLAAALATALAAPAALSSAPAAAAPARMLVICSPGSPGTTAQAQPTLDAFAAEAEKSAGWPGGTLGAIYFEGAEAGIARLSQPDAAIAMVPLPFLMQHGDGLALTPRLLAVAESGPTETWSLVAKKGSLPSPAALAGWEVTGTPGYAPGFVKGGVLAGFGPIPDDARITFSQRPLTALRRAVSGEKVAVILDGAGAAALATLPFAADLEVVHRSRPLPAGFLCTVRDRLAAPEAAKLAAGLERLHKEAAGREILKTMRMSRFEPIDAKSLDEVRRLSGSAATGAPAR